MKNEPAKYITCVRCRHNKKSNCFSSADRKCDQCVSQMKEYNHDEVVAKEHSIKSKVTKEGKKSRNVRGGISDKLEELRLKKEMELYGY